MLFNFICRKTSTHAKPHLRGHLYFCRLQSPSPAPISPSNPPNQHPFPLPRLINSSGFSSETATLASKHVNFPKSPNRADSVLALLMNQGLTKSQVSKLVSSHPKILSCDPDMTLSPNFQTLNSLGLSRADLVSVVTSWPLILLVKDLEKKAIPSFDYLKTVLGCHGKVTNAIKRFPIALTYDLQVYAVDNIRVLRELGVSEPSMVAMLTQQPRTFLTSADNFRRIVEEVKGMGFDPSKSRFLFAIHAIRAMSKSTWDKKVELYKKWGWSQDEISMAFEGYPGCMMASIEKITSILDFLVNVMGWEAAYIAQRSIVIGFSFERRILPRCLVYQYLLERGLAEENDEFSFTKWLMYSDSRFRRWVAKKYEKEAPEMLKVYQRHLDEANKAKPKDKVLNS